jgi:hypothetical protein
LSPASYAGFLTSTADPLTQTVLTGYVLGLPAALVGQLAVPVYRGSGIVLTGGYLFWPGSGFLASPLVRLQLLIPTVSRPGIVLLGGGIYGVAWSGGESLGAASIEGVQLVASSPIRRFRLHIGGALHTMPGSEFSPGDQDAKRYDWKNPKVAMTVLGELRLARSVRVFAEGLWAGIGADEGFDSVATALAGVEFDWKAGRLRLASGLFADRVGAGESRFLPVPPMAAFAYAF